MIRDASYIAAKVAFIRDSGVPDSLNRWRGLTPEALAAYEARLKRITARAASPRIKNPRNVKPGSSGLGVPLGFTLKAGATLASDRKDTTMAKKTTTKRGPHKPVKSKLPGKKKTKIDELVDFLTHSGGRHIKTICAEFGWQAHSARAAISGLTKPKSKGGRGLNVTSTPGDDGSTYEIKLA